MDGKEEQGHSQLTISSPGSLVLTVDPNPPEDEIVVARDIVQAQTLRRAARTGKPFCEKCEQAAIAVTEAEEKKEPPTIEIIPEDVPDLPDHELEAAYKFFISYTGDPNIYDSFKKYDHKYRGLADGPARVVPIVLACLGGESQENRDEVELRDLSECFIRVVGRLVNTGTFKVDVTPPDTIGQIKLSAEPKGDMSLWLDAERNQPAELPHLFATTDDKLFFVDYPGGEVTFTAELTEAEGHEAEGSVASHEREFTGEAAEDDVVASWLAFKKAEPSFGAFSKAVGPDKDLILKLAQIGALYWYSDTGDVLMNAYLRSDSFAKSLKERVTYLKVDYGDDRAMIAKLPSDTDIDRDIGTYEGQVRDQIAMLKDALQSDLLKKPEAGTPLYRGMALLPAQVGDKFEPGQVARLKGFSSSAADAHAAYHFMQTSASEINILNQESGVVATPIFYCIAVGAENGCYLGSYSLHSGESEVLFDEGTYPTVQKKSWIKLIDSPHRFMPHIMVKKLAFTDPSDAEQEGFKHALTEFQKDRQMAEMKSSKMKLKKTKGAAVETGYEAKSLAEKSEQALSEGGFAKLEWPKGDQIMLVKAKMG